MADRLKFGLILFKFSLADLSKGDYVTNVSYDDDLGKYSTKSLRSVLNKLPKPLVADEIYLKTKKIKENEQQQEVKDDKKRVSFLAKILIPLALLLALILLFPWIALKVYQYR